MLLECQVIIIKKTILNVSKDLDLDLGLKVGVSLENILFVHFLLVFRMWPHSTLVGRMYFDLPFCVKSIKSVKCVNQNVGY
jgi:hypothetical protein